jgi:hypothetical protein
MTLVDIKREIAALDLRQQNELAAYIVHLRHQQDPEYCKELERRLDDRRPESWVRLEDAERELGGG